MNSLIEAIVVIGLLCVILVGGVMVGVDSENSRLEEKCLSRIPAVAYTDAVEFCKEYVK